MAPASSSLINSVLVATNGSEGALEAAAYAARLAEHTRASVTIAHVVEVPRVPEIHLPAPDVPAKRQ